MPGAVCLLTVTCMQTGHCFQGMATPHPPGLSSECSGLAFALPIAMAADTGRALPGSCQRGPCELVLVFALTPDSWLHGLKPLVAMASVNVSLRTSWMWGAMSITPASGKAGLSSLS